MSQYSVSVSVTASVPQSSLVSEDMGDKTPPFIHEDCPPSSVIVKTNSFFCQSLVRELSGNSLSLFTSEKNSEKKSLTSENSSICLAVLKRKLSGMLDHESSNTLTKKRTFPTDTKLEEPAEKRSRTLNDELQKQVSERPFISPASETMPADIQPNESEKVNPNTLSVSKATIFEEQSNEAENPVSKVIMSENQSNAIEKENPNAPSFNDATMTEDQSNETGKENPNAPSVNEAELADDQSNTLSINDASMTEDESNEIQKENSNTPSVSDATMSEDQSNEPQKENPNAQSINEAIMSEDQLNETEKDNTNSTSANETTMSEDQLNETEKEEPQKEQVATSQLEASSVIPLNGPKCSICGEINCPLDPNRQSTNLFFSTLPKMTVKRLKTPKANIKLFKKKTQQNKVNSKQTQFRRIIDTRSLANGKTRRLSNSTPLRSWNLKSQLFKAVENGDSMQVQDLIQDTGVAVRKDKTGCTLLHAAASHNQVDVLMFLLKQISPNITNKEGQTPAHMAAARGHIQVLRILQSDTQFDPDRKDKRHNTVKTMLNDRLFGAVMDGDKKQVQRLLDIGADPDSQIRNRTKGVLARELGVSTPRHLARSLNMDSAIAIFNKKAPSNEIITDTSLQHFTSIYKESSMHLRSTKLAKRYDDLCLY